MFLKSIDQDELETYKEEIHFYDGLFFLFDNLGNGVINKLI